MDHLQNCWEEAKRRFETGKVLVITGAGVSAESGIPTFRSEDGTGLYETEGPNPLELLRRDSVEHGLHLLWEYYFTRFRGSMRDAVPNPAHVAIAQMETITGDRFLLVTQNIDGLHIEAGNSLTRTIEIHGNKSMRCSEECWLRKGVPLFRLIPEGASFPEDLTCPDCGSLMRPHVLLFDEHYSQELYRSEEAEDFARGADLVITVGCSAVVPLAYVLADLAVKRGAMLIDVNPGHGPLSELAERSGIWLQEKAGEGVPRILEKFS